MKKYRLKKDYEHPSFCIKSGVIKTDREWCDVFNYDLLSDIALKEDWFEEVEEEIKFDWIIIPRADGLNQYKVTTNTISSAEEAQSICARVNLLMKLNNGQLLSIAQELSKSIGVGHDESCQGCGEDVIIVNLLNQILSLKEDKQ